MKEIAQQIRSILGTVESPLSQMNDEEVEHKSGAQTWSKKEILGHLIDSAANNHQRFVRAAYNAALLFPPYDPEEWVRIQQYQEMRWSCLVELWSAYNHHLSRVLACIPDDAKFSACNIGKEKSVPLEFVIKDYLRHLQHHLKKILEEQA